MNSAHGARILIGLAFVALALATCDGRGRSAETARGAAPAEAGTAAPTGPVERSEGEEFAVEASHEAAATVGQPTIVVVSGTGKAPWHVNIEYPVKFEVLSAEGFTAPGPVLRADAAARFDESELRFEVPLTPTRAGELPVELKLKFGLCNADRCVTREAVFRWTYAVSGG